MSSWLLDFIAVVLLVGNVYLGWRLGLFGRMFAFAGFYGGVAFAAFAAAGLDRFFHGGGSPSDLYTTADTFLATVAVAILMAEILGALYHEKMTKVAAIAFDRTVGAIAGVVVAGFQIAVLGLVFSAVGSVHQDAQHNNLPPDAAKASQAVSDSLIVGRVAHLDPATQAVLRPVLPNDLSDTLSAPTNAK